MRYDHGIGWILLLHKAVGKSFCDLNDLRFKSKRKKQEKLKHFIIDHWSSLKLPLGYHSNWCFKHVFNYVHWPVNKWNRIWSDISLTSPESNAQSIPPPPAAGVHGKLPHLSLPLCRNWKNTHHWSLWWIRTSIIYYITYDMFIYPWLDVSKHIYYMFIIYPWLDGSKSTVYLVMSFLCQTGLSSQRVVT